MDKKMRIINLEFEQFQINNCVLNPTCNSNDKNDQETCSRFCHETLQLINKTEITKMETFKDYLMDNHIIYIIKVFQFYLDHEKDIGKVYSHSEKYYEE